MIRGHIVNNSGRHRHIFKHNLGPGMSIKLETLYNMYNKQYGGEFDEGFLEWLRRNKIPSDGDFELVVDAIYIKPDIGSKKSSKKIKPAAALTASDISNLRIRDNPREKLQYVTSIYKLRRAITLCNHMKGKSTLVDIIKDRIEELKDAE